MKSIQIVLLSAAYISLLPFGAEFIFATCMKNYYGPFGMAVIGLGLCLLSGYSQSVAGHPPWGRPKVFWASSLAFNLLGFSVVLRMTNPDLLINSISLRWGHLVEVFHPVLKSDEMIEGIAGLGFVIVICWMPFAALLSLIAFVITWMDQTKVQGEER